MHSHPPNNSRYCEVEQSLNPCCNGRCTRTFVASLIDLYTGDKVLILVVMEDALAHTNVNSHVKRGTVLILVVMEDALARV